VEPPFEINPDGTMTVPTGLGIGVDVMRDRVEAATQRREVIG
jgi:L-alanine-DL-glutamate epimerase-like enolase superfamily enzyme